MLTVLFDGVAYGMLLFVLAVGLSVTLGLLNFVNLAHGVFGMAGGYVCCVLLSRYDIPFGLCLLAAFAVAALAGLVLERTLYARLYGRTPLDQVLFSVGLVFVGMSGAEFLMGAQQQLIQLPEWLTGNLHAFGLEASRYRVLLIVLCGLVAAALQFTVAWTRFGSHLRASVDNAQMARALGIDVDRIFATTFAVGSGLAGLGGALGVELVGLDPMFPVRFMTYFLAVVVVGGTTTILGPLLASVVLGVLDVAGKYYVPAAGAFTVYAAMIGILVLRPGGLIGHAALR